MNNSNLDNEYLDDEIDLIELLRILYSSKKLIILITLASALIAFAYLAQKEVKYQSTVILEVGSYRLLDGEEKLIEPVSSLIKKLKINEISKQLDELKFESIEDHFLQINYTSPSPEFNENLINQAIKFSQQSYAEILTKLVNSFSDEIKTKELLIDFLKNSSLSNKESYKLEVTNEINKIDSEVGLNKVKINFLSKLLITQKNDLMLEEQLMTLEAKVKALEKKKESLERKIISIDSSDFFVDKEVFEFIQEKNSLEKQTKLIKNSSSKTQPIREVETSEIKTNTLFIILIGTILGFIFSVFIVLIRQSFLKNQN
jgi:LPS O-antigen subunit length determinant protein (WzzB/FepE family)